MGLDKTHPQLMAEWDDKIDISSVTYGSKKKVWWRCKDGHRWQAFVTNRARSGAGCPYCSGRLAIVGVNDLKTVNPGLAREWSDRNTKSPEEFKPTSNAKVWWLGGCGHGWEAHISNRAKGYGCPFCANNLVLSGFNDLATKHPELSEEWSSKNNTGPDMYISGSAKKVWWKCVEEHEWEETIDNRVRKNYGCPACSGKRLVVGVNDLVSKNPSLLGEWSNRNTETADSVHQFSNKKVWWVCEEGHEWEARVADRDRFGCPKCVIPKKQIELFEYVRAMFPDAVMDDRKALRGLEIDVFVPELNVGFEFNGLYWHSEKFIDKGNHKKKSDRARDAGIRLVTIWEDDWRDRRPIVEKMIKHKLGMNDSGRVYARKCVIDSDIGIQEAKDFMGRNHIQGYVGSSYRIGLRHEGVLVALMLLKRYGPDLRLERYATSLSVVGGQSKLLKYVDRSVEYNQMVTFADLMISDGDLYEKTGWVWDAELDPDYTYLVRNSRVHKFNYRLRRFKEDPELIWEKGKTEKELAQINGLYRIWDVGKIRYVRSRSE